MGKSYYEFVDSSDLAIYLEPVESEASKFPIEISFPEDTSSSSYRSLIRLNPHQAGSEYLGTTFLNFFLGQTQIYLIFLFCTVTIDH